MVLRPLSLCLIGKYGQVFLYYDPSSKHLIFHDAVRKKETIRKEKQKEQYNRRHRLKNLSPLKVGDRVWVIDLRVYGVVVEIDKTPNTYWLKSDTSAIRRNRCHLVPAPHYRDVRHSVPNNFIINPSKSPIFDRKPNASDDQNVVCDENVLL